MYGDLVPYTSYRFVEKCKCKADGFKNTAVHRIVEGSWIQCGGFDRPHHRMPCENYRVAHDRRGVLSMCHSGKHVNNSVQFFVTLAPAPLDGLPLRGLRVFPPTALETAPLTPVFPANWCKGRRC